MRDALQEFANPPVVRPCSFSGDAINAAWLARARYTHEVAWAVPDKRALDAIQAFIPGPLWDIGAGHGYWAALLQARGMDVAPLDILQPPEGHVAKAVEPFTAVTRLSEAEILATVPVGSDIMLCWPPYAEDMAFVYTSQLRPKRLVYIGEGRGGCTGGDAFHVLLHRAYEIQDVALPQWDGVHDCLHLCVRKSRHLFTSGDVTAQPPA